MGAEATLGPSGLCHEDFRPENMRIYRNQVTLFDFDDCGHGPQLLDVATMAYWLEHGKHKRPGVLWSAFLAGYGIGDSATLRLAVRWLMLQRQMQSIVWLNRYCVLTDELWEQVETDTNAIVHRIADGRLKVLRASL